MGAKILRNFTQDAEKFTLKEFDSGAEPGNIEYNIRPFAADEEVSVQESRMVDLNLEDPATIENREDEVTDEDYLPPSKLVKASDGVVGERVEMPSGGGADFMESGIFSDAEEKAGEYPTKILRQDENSVEYEEKITALNEEKSALEAKISELTATIEIKTKEFEELKESIPESIAKAKEEGLAEGILQGEEKSRKIYTAEKDDYLVALEGFNKEALGKLDEIDNLIKSIDDEMAKTVIGFVKSIIGAERKINDAFIIQLIRANSDKLRELKVIRLVVHPDDAEMMRSVFKNYPIDANPDIIKGSVKIISKVGEVDLNASTMVADLEKQINETIGTPVKP